MPHAAHLACPVEPSHPGQRDSVYWSYLIFPLTFRRVAEKSFLSLSSLLFPRRRFSLSRTTLGSLAQAVLYGQAAPGSRLPVASTAPPC